MKKFIFFLILVAIAACAAFYFLKSNGPTSVAEKYITALQKGDYKGALEYTALDQKTKDQYLALLNEKAGQEKPDKDLIVSFKIIDETIDKEAGTAVVTASVTYANGETKEQKIPMTKDPEAGWLVKDVK